MDRNMHWELVDPEPEEQERPEESERTEIRENERAPAEPQN
jgi:hypothetical protein